MGDFVVVWDSDGSYGTDTSRHSIQGQRYDAERHARGRAVPGQLLHDELPVEASVAVDPMATS